MGQHFVEFGDVAIKMDSDYLLGKEGPNQVRTETRVFCLCMSMLQLGQKNYLFSLVLKESSLLTGTFERISMMKNAGAKGCVYLNSTIFCRAKTRTVVIV